MVKINFQNNVTKANADTFNTMQDNIEDAINNVSIDLDDQVSTSSTNGIENQAITNYVNTQISGMSAITEGTGTANASYVGSVENNKWTRVGQIVCFSFTLTTNNTLDYTTTLFTGLPRAKNNMRFMGLWTNNNWPLRLEITDDGRLQNSWSSSNPTSGQTVEACVIYITKD